MFVIEMMAMFDKFLKQPILQPSLGMKKVQGPFIALHNTLICTAVQHASICFFFFFCG